MHPNETVTICTFPISSPELFVIPITGGSATLYPSSKIMFGELHSPVTNLRIGDKFINNEMITLMFEQLLNAKVSKVYKVHT